jgi:hypothetical protein
LLNLGQGHLPSLSSDAANCCSTFERAQEDDPANAVDRSTAGKLMKQGWPVARMSSERVGRNKRRVSDAHCAALRKSGGQMAQCASLIAPYALPFFHSRNLHVAIRTDMHAGLQA